MRRYVPPCRSLWYWISKLTISHSKMSAPSICTLSCMCDGIEPAHVLVQGHGVEADQAVAVAIKTDIVAAIRHQAHNNKVCNSTHVASVAIDDIGKLGVGSRICVELREGHTGRRRLPGWKKT
jgi:hypothetical protein